MRIIFTESSWNEYLGWQDDPKIFARLNLLIDDVRRTPFEGIGKPEPLKHGLSGWWSRRITDADRLVYRVSGKGDQQALEIAQCRFHYR